MSFTSRRVFLSSVLASSVGLACRPQVIPKTDVEDIPLHRELVDFCEGYRHGVEQRDVPALLRLAHPDYYEDGGNVDSSDDIDYAGLEEFLKSRYRDSKAIRYEMRYRRIGTGRRPDTYFVDYTYSASYQIITNKGDVWRRAVSDNRLELIRVRDSYQILAGM